MHSSQPNCDLRLSGTPPSERPPPVSWHHEPERPNTTLGLVAPRSAISTGPRFLARPCGQARQFAPETRASGQGPLREGNPCGQRGSSDQTTDLQRKGDYCQGPRPLCLDHPIRPIGIAGRCRYCPVTWGGRCALQANPIRVPTHAVLVSVITVGSRRRQAIVTHRPPHAAIRVVGAPGKAIRTRKGPVGRRPCVAPFCGV